MVVTAAHAFQPIAIQTLADGSKKLTIGANYDFINDCTFNVLMMNADHSYTKIFTSKFISMQSGSFASPDFDADQDWAVMHLSTRPPPSLGINILPAMRLTEERLAAGSIGVTQFSFSHLGTQIQKIKSQGYAFNSSSLGSSASNLALEHNCDTSGVSSGGALTILRGGHYYFFGIHTGAMTFDTNSGVRLHGAFYQALADAVAWSDARSTGVAK